MFFTSLTHTLYKLLETDTKATMSATETYMNATGRVVEPLRGFQPGKIRLHGVYWFAKLATSTKFSIPKNSTVTVIGREGNTLLVEPLIYPIVPLKVITGNLVEPERWTA